MQSKINIFFIAAILLLINAIGFLLRYFQLEDYIIIAGFRFQVSLVLPFFFIFRKKHFNLLKEYFIKPVYKKYSVIFIWILIPILSLVPSLLVLKKITISDPYRFYELGLSSIADFPIYLIWNFPQLLLFVIFLFLSVEGRKFKFLVTTFITITLFLYQFIPIHDKILFNLDSVFSNYVPLVLLAIGVGILIKYFP